MCGHHKKQTQLRHCPRHTVKYIRDKSSDSGSDNDCQNEYTFSTSQGERTEERIRSSFILGHGCSTMLGTSMTLRPLPSPWRHATVRQSVKLWRESGPLNTSTSLSIERLSSQSSTTTSHWRPFGRSRDHHFGSSAGDFISNHTGWSSNISPVQTTQPTICPGIQQNRGSCTAMSNTWQSTV